MAEILLITSDEDMVRQIKGHFDHRHLKLRHESDAASALMILAARPFSLMILDMDGIDTPVFEAVSSLRGQSSAPIFVISAKAAESDVILALDTGADEHISKPLRPGELAAQVDAALRRQKMYGADDDRENDLVEARDICVDIRQKKVFIRGREKKFTRREYELLLFLMRHPDEVFTKEELYRHVWGEEVVGDMATVTVHIKKLRSMIEEKPAYPTIIGTEWGVGYVFWRKAPAW